MTSCEKTVDELNAEFRVGENVLFERGTGGQTKVVLSNQSGRGEVYLFGGVVTHFAETGRYPLLWDNRDAVFDGRKAIRAGVPICWPWFNSHATNPALPSHGFARIRLWQVRTATHDASNNHTELVLTLESDDETREMFPHDFKLELSVQVSSQLRLQLTIHNTGESDFDCATALHTYLAIANIDNIHIAGLENVQFMDQLLQNATSSEPEPLVIDQEIDRIYFGSENEVRVMSPERTITIAKTGSKSTVVWNPWIEKSKRMNDFPNKAFREMLCVETANVASDARKIAKGQSHVITQTISSR